MANYNDVMQLLIKIEQFLVESHLASKKPLPEAFMSQEPFYIDTMSATEWLQWVFVPKMKQLIATRQPLPARCALAPYFEDVLTSDNTALLLLLQELDNLLNKDL